MSIEAMKQALEALEYDTRPETEYGINTAITALRQAIAEAEKQEPVAWMDRHFTCDLYKNKPDLDVVPLYTHPQPKREWVGLTDEDFQPMVHKAMMYYGYDPKHSTLTSGAGFYALVRAVEAKLKEKNT